jgi:hypothetical protein
MSTLDEVKQKANELRKKLRELDRIVREQTRGGQRYDQPGEEMAGGRGEDAQPGENDLTILSNEQHTISDLKTVARAIRRRWDISDETREVIGARLLKIMRKETVLAMTRDGPMRFDGPADSNAVAAARVFVAMNGQDQADDHLIVKREIERGGSTDTDIDDAIANELANVANREETSPAAPPPSSE